MVTARRPYACEQANAIEALADDFHVLDQDELAAVLDSLLRAVWHGYAVAAARNHLVRVEVLNMNEGSFNA